MPDTDQPGGTTQVSSPATGTPKTSLFPVSFLLTPLPMLAVFPARILVAYAMAMGVIPLLGTMATSVLILVPGLVVCAAVGGFLFRKPWGQLSAAQRKSFLVQTLQTTLAFSILFGLIPYMVYAVFAGSASSYDYATPLVGFFSALLLVPIVPVVITIIGYLLVSKAQPAWKGSGNQVGSVLVASWAAQFIVLAVLGAMMAHTFRPSIPYVYRCIAASPDCVHCAIGDEKGNLNIQKISFPHGQQTWSVAPLGVKALSYTPDGRYLASGLSDNSIVLWDLRSLQRVHVLQDVSPEAWSYSGAGGSLMVFSKDRKSLQLWDAIAWRQERTFAWHGSPGEGDMATFTLSPDGNSFFIGHGDGMVRQHDLETGQVIHEYPPTVPRWGPSRALFLDDRTMVAVDGGGLSIWDLPSGKLTKKYEQTGHTWLKEVPIWGKNRILITRYDSRQVVEFPSEKILFNDISKVGPEEQAIAITPDGKKLLFIKVNNGELGTTRVSW